MAVIINRNPANACPNAVGAGHSMPCDSEETVIVREYKNHLIVVTAGQHEGRWTSQYLILDAGVSGSCDGSFATRDEAAAAGIQLAKDMIDSRQ